MFRCSWTTDYYNSAEVCKTRTSSCSFLLNGSKHALYSAVKLCVAHLYVYLPWQTFTAHLGVSHWMLLFFSDWETDPCSQIKKNRLLPRSHRETPALREANFETEISKQGFVTPCFLRKSSWTSKLLKSILSTFSLKNVDLPKIKHSKEVRTSDLFPSSLPGKFSGTSQQLSQLNFSEFAASRASASLCHWKRSLAAMGAAGRSHPAGRNTLKS